MREYDVVVVGGGAAGLSAALVLARALRRVAVVDAGTPRNAPAEHMHGYLGRDGLPPRELVALGRQEIGRYGGEFVDTAATRIERVDGHRFLVVLADGRELGARRLIVATGIRDELPELPGVRERWGRDVLHCPYCHGYEVRDRPIGVLSGPSRAFHQAHLLREWTADVLFFTDGTETPDDQRDALAARGIGLIEGRVAELVVTDDRLSGICMEDGRVVARAALFLSPHAVPNNDLLLRLGCELDDYGWVDAHRTGRTSVPGVWVAGNVINPRGQVVTAAGEGSSAAIAVNWDLVQEDVHREVRTYRGQS